jgi:RimJ/RimL family protein N-acetyltransferase
VIRLDDPAPVLAALARTEGPGPEALAGHVAHTGHGRVWVDRPVDPAVVLVSCAGNVLLRGDPGAADPRALAPLVVGWVDAPAGFEPLLRAASDRYLEWQRMVFVLDGAASDLPGIPGPDGAQVRRLTGADADLLAAQPEEFGWVAKTWPDARAITGSGHAWAGFVDGALASVATSFYRGTRYEDLAVVTHPPFRRRGLSAAAAAGVCRDVLARGHRPSWTTWRENEASRATAARLGFRHHHDRPVYLVGIDPPSD